MAVTMGVKGRGQVGAPDTRELDSTASSLAGMHGAAKRKCQSLKTKNDTNRNWESWRRNSFRRKYDVFYLGYIGCLVQHLAGEYLRKLDIQDRASENGQVKGYRYLK